MKLELTSEEKAVLEELLNRAHAELPIEIHHCSTSDFKDHLKGKQKIVESLIQKLKN
ncbi:MAG TPA: hypothetical protein PKX79_05370 [Spirochaetota bacterium]|jgi:tRNA G26 N,N-dimethylase Trm1|nr:hypothetical protein [Spirochaetota bacterium]OQA99863.1 MAG: hypothetical protein BWY23_00430 [Spirochaetes bacterium ADurb.Bin218]HOK01148.1 hypothetical protein [Spirochaetota bacterium]HOK92396.1 hypothetical protein [Spirochaetota bacterium]HON16610.1 hypothetical protein [Spirochaetota bacterium]